jgi:hypothetical protein
MKTIDPSEELRTLYPEFSEEELEEAEENLNRYVNVVLRIYERIEATDPEAYAEFKKRIEEKRNKSA